MFIKESVSKLTLWQLQGVPSDHYAHMASTAEIVAWPDRADAGHRDRRNLLVLDSSAGGSAAGAPQVLQAEKTDIGFHHRAHPAGAPA